jgi:predicted methyltransferase
MKPISENIAVCPIEIPPEISTNVSIKNSDTPQNISEFKEAFITVLISYFKNNVVLLNNLIELFDKIITKVDDLRLLISLLLSIPKAVVVVEVEEIILKGCCKTICKQIPRYRKVKE